MKMTLTHMTVNRVGGLFATFFPGSDSQIRNSSCAVHYDPRIGSPHWIHSAYAGRMKRSTLVGKHLPAICGILVFASQAMTAQPTLESVSFFGGPGDQNGSAIAIRDNAVYVAGYGTNPLRVN